MAADEGGRDRGPGRRQGGRRRRRSLTGTVSLAVFLAGLEAPLLGLHVFDEDGRRHTAAGFIDGGCLRLAVSDARVALADADATMWPKRLEPLRELPGGPGFLDAFDALAARFMDVMYGTERLLDRPDLLLHTLLELANVAPRDARPAEPRQGAGRAELEARLFDAIGPARRDEAPWNRHGRRLRLNECQTDSTFMSLLTLGLLSAVMLCTPLSVRADPDPLSAYRWKHRLLVVYVPDTESGRATLRTFRASLDDRMEDVLARDLLIVPVGDLPRPGDALRPAIDVGAQGRSDVRRRFELEGPEVQLLLIGKDGGMKARQSGAMLDLERVFELVDSMPMRRAEMQRR